MTHFVQPLLVGEVNPYGTEPEFALYPLPEHATGGRLARILDMSRSTYLRAFRRVNLCDGTWSMPRARKRAEALRFERGPLILLGRKVAEAFGFRDVGPFERFSAPPGGICLPHPSGRNPIWNDPGAAEQARALVYSLLPPRPTAPPPPSGAADDEGKEG